MSAGLEVLVVASVSQISDAELYKFILKLVAVPQNRYAFCMDSEELFSQTKYHVFLLHRFLLQFNHMQEEEKVLQEQCYLLVLENFQTKVYILLRVKTVGGDDLRFQESADQLVNVEYSHIQSRLLDLFLNQFAKIGFLDDFFLGLKLEKVQVYVGNNF